MIRFNCFKQGVAVLSIVVAAAVCQAQTETVPGDAAKISHFRAQLTNIAQSEVQISTLLGNEAGVDAAQKQLDRARSLTDTEVGVLADSGVKLEALDSALSTLRSILETRAAEPAEAAGASAKVAAGTAKTAGFPSASYSGVCGNSRPDTTAMYAAKVALQAGKIVWVALSRACDEVIVILGAGGNASVACIIADEALVALESILESFDFCDEDIDSSNIDGTYERVGHLHGDIEDSKNTIVNNDNTNRATIVTNNNTNAAAITANDNTNAGTITSNDNANKTAIVNNDNTNAAAITSNDNANKTAIVNNDNTNAAAIIANSNMNRMMVIANQDANTTALMTLILASKGEVIQTSNDNRVAIINEIQTVGCEIIKLLCTPEGQRGSTIIPCTGRPAFPYDFPEKNNVAGTKQNR